MFKLKTTGWSGKGQRLISTEKMSSDDFDKLARELSTKPFTARKIGFVAATQSNETQTIDTHWNGKETTNQAEPGDWIATNLAPDMNVIRDGDGHANTYVIKADAFPRLYAPTEEDNAFGDIYRATATVEALYLSGGFDILAPWDERQVAPTGYLLRNNGEVYGNNKQTFETTYEITG